MKIYTLKCRINGALFRLKYRSRAARDSRADVLATNGITVVCGTRYVKAPDVPRT